MELSPEEKVFIETVTHAPGMIEFDFEKFRTTYPSLLNGICLSMKAMVELSNTEAAASIVEFTKKISVAVHNLEKLHTSIKDNPMVFPDITETIKNTLSVIK
jgi:uncharacterized protein (UPF0276 family)